VCVCEISSQASNFLRSLVDELKRENDELKRENTSLRAKLRSLSACSLCAQPLSGPSGSAFVSPSNAPAPRTSVESEEQLDELASRFSQFDFNEFESKYFGSASSVSLADHAIAVSISARCSYC
jgi:hypothetical protein